MLVRARVAGALVLASLAAGALPAAASEASWAMVMMAGSRIVEGDVAGNNNQNLAVTYDYSYVRDDPATADARDGLALIAEWPPAGGYCAMWRPWQPTGGWGYFERDARRPTTGAGAQAKRWDDILVWARNGTQQQYPTDQIVIWIEGVGVPNVLNGEAITYSLIMTWAPPEYWNDPLTPKQWVLPPFPGPLDGTKRVDWYSFTLPLDGCLMQYPLSGDGPLASTQIGGYRFSFVTPEPPALAGLAIPLGLFLSRRRR